jgi:hypothetical protein
MWLASNVGLSKIPGTSELDPDQLLQGYGPWMVLLFHAAWAQPAGTILRAWKDYPRSLMTKVELEKRQRAAVGFDRDDLGSFADFANAERAVRERNKSLTKEQLDKERIEVYEQVCSEAKQRITDGQYMSILHDDPFTSSAALLDLLAAEREQIATPEAKNPALDQPLNGEVGEWCIPMPQIEMARRITGKKRARAREVQAFLRRHGLECVRGNKWKVRLDKMDQDTRRKLESPLGP